MSEWLAILMALATVILPLGLAWYLMARYLAPRRDHGSKEKPRRVKP